MGIDRDNPQARQFIYHSLNPKEMQQRPQATFPQVIRPGAMLLGNVYKPVTTEVVYYKDQFQQGQRAKVEKRKAVLATQSLDDIAALATKPEFRLPQVVVENPTSDPRDWEAYVWFRSPSEVLDKLEDPNAVFEYTHMLAQSRIPWVSMSDVSLSRLEALSIIARDNSNYIRNQGREPRKPITERQLTDTADAYDESLQAYWLRFPGMLNNFVNLSGSDMLISTLMTPSQRAACMAMVGHNEQAAFMNQKIGEAFANIGTKLKGNTRNLMGDALRILTWSHKALSHDDMLKELGLSDSRQELARVTKSKLVEAVNLPSNKLVAMAFMDPQTRLAALTEAQQAQAYTDGWNNVRSRLLADVKQFPTARAGISLYRDADRYLAA